MSDLLDPATPVRRPRIDHPEHRLQTACLKFAREQIVDRHLFLAFDRSRKQSAMQYVRERARGLMPGTPDCVVLANGKAAWFELKVRPNKPSEAQLDVGRAICAAGGVWQCIWLVEEMALTLESIGVTLRPNALLYAQAKDRELAGLAAVKKVPRAPRAYKPRAEKPTAARVRRQEKIRAPGGVLY